MTLAQGEKVAGRFEVDAWAGSGAHGAVYRARDLRTGEQVALKLLTAGADGGARFAREVRALASLDHPGIVRHVDHGVASGLPFVAMEWIEGGDLATRLRHHPIPWSEALAMARGVAEALGAAHARGILHRDVKPQNILLRGGDPAAPVLADFGTARLSHATELTAEGTIIGTAAYMAPEQARALPTLDARADVFALGAVLFHAVAGRVPFEGDELLAVLVKVLFHEPPALSELVADVPTELSEACRALMAKEPARRPADGAQAARLLAAVTAAGVQAQHVRSWGERRLAVIVVALRPQAGGDDAPLSRRPVPPPTSGAVSSALEAFGARVLPLADGSFAAMLQDGAATDLALAGVRAAQTLRALLPDARLSVATGLDELDPQRPGGATIDRAVLLARGVHDGVAVDQATAALVGGRFAILGPPEALRVGPEVDRLTGGELLGRPTPFVGRDRDVATLKGLSDESASESVARAALVLGAAGNGKTRLLSELLRALRASSPCPSLWIASGDPEHRGSPLRAVADLVLSACGASATHDPAERRARLRARVDAVVEADAGDRVFEFLSELTGLGAAMDTARLFAARLDPRLMSAQATLAVEQFLGGELAHGAVVLVLDDAHDLDDASVALLDALLRRFEASPLCLIVAARPELSERHPDFLAARDPLALRLGALPPRACERIVRASLGDAATPEVIAALVTRSNGHPFSLEELIRAIHEGRDGALPDSLIALTHGRLDLLPPEGRAVLRALSTFGEVGWVGGVRAVLRHLGEEAIGAWITSLVDREFLERRPTSRFPGELEVRFRQSLVRETAYSTWTVRDLAVAHGIVGRWLEERGEPDAAALGLHYERAGDQARARSCFHRAAAHAQGSNDLSAAIGWAERARRAGAEGRELAELYVLEAQAHHWIGRREPAERLSREALALAEPGSRAFFDAGSMAIDLLMSDRDLSRVMPVAEVLAATALLDPEDAANQRARFFALSRVVTWALYAGKSALAEATLATLVRDHKEGRDHALSARVTRARAAMAQFAGRLDEYCRLTEQSLRHVEVIGDFRMMVIERLTLGYAKVTLGRYDEAERLLLEGRALAEKLHFPPLVANALQNLSVVQARTGRLEEAVESAHASQRFYAEQGDAFLEAASRRYLADALLALGRVEEAIVEAQAAALAQQAMPPAAASSVAMMARGWAAAGDAEAALAAARNAMDTLLRPAGVDEGEATIRLAWVESLLAAGRHGEARDAARAAVARIEELKQRLDDPVSKEAFEAIAEHETLRALAGPRP